MPGDGNCLFTAVAHNLVDRLKNNDEAVFCSLNRLGVLSNTPNELCVSFLANALRRLVVQEWLGENAEYYQGFVTTDIATHAHQYLNSGEFGGDLGDLMVVTLSNILHIPITIFSNIPDLGLVCITPTSGMSSIIPLYLTYNNYGSGHYDYALPIDSTSNTPPSSPNQCATRCFCGRNKARKGTPCGADIIGNCRCPCAKKQQPCTSSCRCKSCSNIYGIRCAHSTRERESYSSQKQPLAGRKGSRFLKMADETESIGQTTSFERLLLAAIVVHLMAKGICPTSQNMCKAYNVIYRITSMFPFLELPLFKRSLQLFSSYILTVQKTIELFSQLFPK